MGSQRDSSGDGLTRPHTFRYRQDQPTHPARPIVSVDLEFDGRRIGLGSLALVDSGSPATFFDSSVMLDLGMRKRPPDETIWFHILGTTSRAQFESVRLTLLDDIDGRELLSWQADVAFLHRDDLQLPFRGCLGTQGFLDRFAVTFVQSKNYFVVDDPDLYTNRTFNGGVTAQ